MLVEHASKMIILLILSVIPMTAIAQEVAEASTNMNDAVDPGRPTAALLQQIAAFDGVPVSARDAISTAEKRSKGSKAVDISFDGEAGRLQYKVETYLLDELWTGVVDASTGAIAGDGIVTPLSNLGVKDRGALAGLKTSGIDLSEAARIAEQYGAGKAVSAGLEEQSGKLSFLVVIVADGSLRQISVSPDRK